MPLELSELARNAVHEWVQTSFALKIDLGFEQPGYPVMVRGNPTMQRELLNNLIDNALRYTPGRGSVTVRVRTDAALTLATVAVEDTGPGIAPAERGHVFERFYRILGSNVEGSGLGLAIVHEIAQQHAAAVEVGFNHNALRLHPLHEPNGVPSLPQAPAAVGSVFRVTLRVQHSLQSIEDLG